MSAWSWESVEPASAFTDPSRTSRKDGPNRRAEAALGIHGKLDSTSTSLAVPTAIPFALFAQSMRAPDDRIMNGRCSAFPSSRITR